ncbi:uncharacterized protein PG986_002494 [Apiospora aurea]|uniref:Aminoglycoside phosphotransferase domain-containing protein n=1 Tax=Apiospora aurea TaxID=335848 RepID=A0ABR1QNZ3_9PEZI
MPSDLPQKRTSWGATIYTLDGSIQEFFQNFGGNTAVTKSDCDAKAAALMGSDEPVTPVPLQGHWSYTVVAGGPEQVRIVQFRAAKSKLDMDIMELAASVHPDFVPKCRYHGPIGDATSPLQIYVMVKREGLCSFETRDSSVEGASAFAARQFQTVRDFARQAFSPFFAEAWKNPQQITPAAAAEKVRQDVDAGLNRLTEGLPGRFHATVKQVRADLPVVFGLLPFVINRGDLHESNILVNKDDGRITGIIDWAEAEISRFGLSLWGLESITGYSRKKAWYAYDNAEQLRAEFWRVFEAEVGTAALSDKVKHAIKVSRMAGMLLAWRFDYDQGAGRGKVRDLDGGLGRADVFCTGGI